MQLNKLAVALAATFQVALANFGDLSVPATIVAGKEFNITGHYLLDKAGYPLTVLLGIFPANNSTDTPDLTYAPLGDQITSIDIDKQDLGRYNVTISNIVVPPSMLSGRTTFFLQWFQISVVGIENYMGGESYLLGPITTGTQISSQLVTVARGGPGYKAYPLHS